jgi:hypothetical protein
MGLSQKRKAITLMKTNKRTMTDHSDQTLQNLLTVQELREHMLDALSTELQALEKRSDEELEEVVGGVGSISSRTASNVGSIASSTANNVGSISSRTASNVGKTASNVGRTASNVGRTFSNVGSISSRTASNVGSIASSTTAEVFRDASVKLGNPISRHFAKNDSIYKTIAANIAIGTASGAVAGSR